MSFKSDYEESYAYAASSCSNLVASHIRCDNGMTANYNQKEARLAVDLWLKELYCIEKEGKEMVDPYTEFLFNHYDKYIGDFEDHNLENYLKRYLEDIKTKFADNEHLIPKNFEYDYRQTIDLIARRNAYIDMYKFLETIQFDKSDDMFSVLIKFKEHKKQPTIKNIQIISEKIDWKGTQKELAELFIELKNKGWIEEVNPTKIMNAFTQSDTIQQVLKPGNNPKTKIDEYNQIYTKRYKPKFKGIEQNLIKLKNK